MKKIFYRLRAKEDIRIIGKGKAYKWCTSNRKIIIEIKKNNLLEDKISIDDLKERIKDKRALGIDDDIKTYWVKFNQCIIEKVTETVEIINPKEIK